MGLLRELVKLPVKAVLAPVYIPYKIADCLSKPSQYNHWYHDSGRDPVESNCEDQSQSE